MNNETTCKAEYDELLEISGKQLRVLRRQAHLTMQALADICHLTRQTIFALESDHKDQPSAFHVHESTKLLVIITLIRLVGEEPGCDNSRKGRTDGTAV